MPDATEHDLDEVLTPAPDPDGVPPPGATSSARTGLVTGRVLDATGAPVAGVSVVALMDAPHQEIAAFTTPDGAFRLGALPPGPVTLAAAHQGLGGSATTQVVAGEATSVEIRIS